MSPQERAEAVVKLSVGLTGEACMVKIGNAEVVYYSRQSADEAAEQMRAAVASAVEAHMAEAGLGEPPVSDEKLEEARAWANRHNSLMVAVYVLDLLALIDHLRAQVAWLTNEQGCQQAYAAGKASCVCRFCSKAPEVCTACYERDLLIAEER